MCGVECGREVCGEGNGVAVFGNRIDSCWGAIGWRRCPQAEVDAPVDVHVLQDLRLDCLLLAFPSRGSCWAIRAEGW